MIIQIEMDKEMKDALMMVAREKLQYERLEKQMKATEYGSGEAEIARERWLRQWGRYEQELVHVGIIFMSRLSE